MKSSLIAGLAAALALTAFGAAGAQDLQSPAAGPGAGAGGHGHMGQACKADAAKFCSDVQHGGGRMMQCFKAHKDELSDGCKSALVQMRAEHKAAKAAALAPAAPN
jgi:hypothetical protein